MEITQFPLIYITSIFFVYLLRVGSNFTQILIIIYSQFPSILYSYYFAPFKDTLQINVWISLAQANYDFVECLASQSTG